MDKIEVRSGADGPGFGNVAFRESYQAEALDCRGIDIPGDFAFERQLRIETQLGPEITRGGHDVLQEPDLFFRFRVIAGRVILRIGLQGD